MVDYQNYLKSYISLNFDLRTFSVYGYGPCILSSYLFYSDMGKPERIERSSLIGQERTSIITSGVDRVYDITVDHKEHKLYWVDAGRHTLESSDYDGRNRRLLTRMNSVKFTSVVVFGVSFLYVFKFIQLVHNYTLSSNPFYKYLFSKSNINIKRFYAN